MKTFEDITEKYIEQLFSNYINYGCVNAGETLKTIFSENKDLREKYKFMIEESRVLN